MARYLFTMQLILLLLLIIFSNLFNLFTFIHLTIGVGLGIILGVWTILTLGKNAFSIFPMPKKGTELNIAGPYKFIRQPLYLSLILIAFTLLLSRIMLITLLIFLLFVWTVDTKANFEEQILEKKYPEYKKYQAKTPKYFPVYF